MLQTSARMSLLGTETAFDVLQRANDLAQRRPQCF